MVNLVYIYKNPGHDCNRCKRQGNRKIRVLVILSSEKILVNSQGQDSFLKNISDRKISGYILKFSCVIVLL